MKRRKFIISTATFGTLYPFFQLFAIKNRKFKVSLKPGSIDLDFLEKFYREKYFMKKSSEEIFYIENE